MDDPTDQHPNEIVHAITAERLADRIAVSLQSERRRTETRGNE